MIETSERHMIDPRAMEEGIEENAPWVIDDVSTLKGVICQVRLNFWGVFFAILSLSSLGKGYGSSFEKFPSPKNAMCQI